jgi:hypothetical protein
MHAVLLLLLRYQHDEQPPLSPSPAISAAAAAAAAQMNALRPEVSNRGLCCLKKVVWRAQSHHTNKLAHHPHCQCDVSHCSAVKVATSDTMFDTLNKPHLRSLCLMPILYHCYRTLLPSGYLSTLPTDLSPFFFPSSHLYTCLISTPCCCCTIKVFGSNPIAYRGVGPDYVFSPIYGSSILLCIGC